MTSRAEGRQIMRDRPEISSELLGSLRSLRRGTLGREYLEWLERGDVTPDTREPVRPLMLADLTTSGPIHRLSNSGIHDATLPPDS